MSNTPESVYWEILAAMPDAVFVSNAAHYGFTPSDGEEMGAFRVRVVTELDIGRAWERLAKEFHPITPDKMREKIIPHSPAGTGSGVDTESLPLGGIVAFLGNRYVHDPALTHPKAATWYLKAPGAHGGWRWVEIKPMGFRGQESSL